MKLYGKVRLCIFRGETFLLVAKQLRGLSRPPHEVQGLLHHFITHMALSDCETGPQANNKPIIMMPEPASCQSRHLPMLVLSPAPATAHLSAALSAPVTQNVRKRGVDDGAEEAEALRGRLGRDHA